MHPPSPIRPGGRRIALVLAALAATAIATGCQTYTPQPLDADAHRGSWHGRTLEEVSLGPFVERLAASPDTAPEFAPANGLSLAEGQLFALAYNPDLRLARLRLDRARAFSEAAGLPDDPVLSLGALRVTSDVPNNWIVSPELSFSVPLSSRLEVERDHAGAEQIAAECRVLEHEWSVVRDVRIAWTEWSAARLRYDETRRLVASMSGLVATAVRLAELGEVPEVEATLFELERAQGENRLRRLDAETRAAEQRVRAHLGLSPDAPLELVPALASASDAADAGPDAIADRNPSLARLRAEYDVAEERVRLEIEKQLPDLQIGPAYERDQGQSRWGLTAGVPLPVLNANAQGIATARAERELARAAFETEYERLIGRFATARARLEGLAAQRADLESNLVPLVDRQLASAARLLELGEANMLVLLESVAQAHETKLGLIDTRLSEAQAQAELDYLVGPQEAVPATAPEESR